MTTQLTSPYPMLSRRVPSASGRATSTALSPGRRPRYSRFLTPLPSESRAYRVVGRRRPVMMGGMGTSADADDAPAGPGPALCRPAPTGPCPAGTTCLWLTDTSRPDPWAAGVSARELMVSLWYPAEPSDGPRARYMTSAESELQLTSRGITGVPPDMLSTVRTNAAIGATPTGIPRSLPLVVLSPGFINSRSTLSGVAEDLASHAPRGSGLGG